MVIASQSDIYDDGNIKSYLRYKLYIRIFCTSNPEIRGTLVRFGFMSFVRRIGPDQIEEWTQDYGLKSVGYRYEVQEECFIDRFDEY